LVRDLARAQLEAAGEQAATLGRYAQVAVQIAQTTQTLYLAGGADLLAALARFDMERPHIDAAWRWATQHAGAPAADTLLLAATAAILNIALLRYDQRHEHLPQLEQALAAARRLGDQHSEWIALASLGNTYWSFGDLQRSIFYYEQALTIAQVLGDRHSEGVTRTNLGNAYMGMGDPQRSIFYYEQALTIARALGHRRGEGRALHNLGLAYYKLGEGRRAITYSKQALRIAQEMGEWYGESTI